jgi:penicillin-binding protein 1A
MYIRWLAYLLSIILGVALVSGLVLGFVIILAYPNLPSLEALTDYQPKIPLRIYSAEGELIGEFGEERRALVKIDAVPVLMRKAIIAAEDERFYEHGGVDYIGVVRAAISNLTSGGKRQGASTITMQVARNFFLSSEKTLTRKLNEVLLAFKIENSLSKDEILQLYINQIYLGQRAYGFAAASQVYFGKPLDQLSVAEIAMLAGLPKAPSLYNPITNPKRAKTRQLYVLRRMRELSYINDEQTQIAQKQLLHIKRELADFDIRAEYVAEMVRQVMFESYHDDAYVKGFKVYTTIRRADQEAAYAALRKGVMEYDKRHGYRGPEGFINIPEGANVEEILEDALIEVPANDDLIPAVVLEASNKLVKAYKQGGEIIEIHAEGLKFAQKLVADKSAKIRIRRGSLIRAQKDEKNQWHIVQLPQVEAAIVSLNPKDGAIRGLIGGFDFNRNKFNHVTQAMRQPGSSFKPFIYSAAMERGFTPATIINDAPIVIDANEAGGEVWEPKNYDGTFSGPIRLRTALTLSKNLVSIRILQAITPKYAQDYITRFGFEAKDHRAYLTMALGAGSTTPLQMVVGYSVFANGGYRVYPYLIDKVLDAKGNVLAQAKPLKAGENAQQVIDPRNAFLMTNIMQDVTRVGTGARVAQLGRQDLAGKTGTTNEQVDAWFAGFQATLTTVAWIGFDKPHSLGPGETGAVAALPIWMDYMGKVLKGVPEQPFTPPPGVVSARVNLETGLRELPGSKGGVVDYFYQENLPRVQEETTVDPATNTQKSPEEIKNQLF